MDLNQTQIDTVKQWIADGASISDVQKNLKENFNIIMKFIDVRFLIDDIGAELSKPAPIVESTDETSLQNQSELANQENYPQEEASGIEISVSPIQRPDCFISGDATFTNGAKCEWRVDRMGQLSLIPDATGIQPPQSDMQEFQMKLQEIINNGQF